MGEENDSVEQAVAERRERLRALRAAQELLSKREEDGQEEKSDHEDAEEDNGEQEDNPSMKFRNYVPHDKQLQEAKVAPPVLAKFEDPVAVAPPPSEKEDPLLNIAPKKPNWDLKRDVQKKLEKLDRRTQKAMHKLMVEQEKQKEMSGDEAGQGDGVLD